MSESNTRRPGATPTPLDDVNALIHAGMAAAQRLLTECGELPPFAAVMRPTGQPEIIYRETDAAEPEWLITSVALWRQLRDEVADKAATAVAYFSEARSFDRAAQQVDRFVRIEIESEGLDPIRCSVPFGLTAGGPSWGEWAQQPGDRVLFPARLPPGVSAPPPGLQIRGGGLVADRLQHFQAVCDAVRDRLAEGELGEALGFAQAAVELTLRMFGPGHSQLATAMRNLGIIYGGLSQHHRAVAAYRIAVEVAAESAGDDPERHSRYSAELKGWEAKAGV